MVGPLSEGARRRLPTAESLDMIVPRPRLTSAFLALALVVTAGCGDDTSSVDLGDLQPIELALALDDLVSPLQASSEASINLEAAVEDLGDAGIVLEDRAPAAVARTLAVIGLDPAVPPMAVEFPENVLGSTFTLQLPGLTWEVDDNRDGAPADGVRVIWYELDGTGGVVEPLVEMGFIDIVPVAGTTGDAVSVRIVDTTDTEEQVLLDFVQEYATSDNGTAVEEFSAAGTYANAITSVEFTLSSFEAATESTGDQEYSVEVMLDATDLSYDMLAEGVVDGETGVYDDAIRATATGSAGTTVLEVAFEGTDDAQEEAGGSLTHDGEEVAQIRITGSNFEFLSPGGERLGATEANGLNALFRAMTTHGLYVIYGGILPLFFLF